MKENVKYIPLCLLVAFSLKGLVSGVSFQDAPVFFILAGLCAHLISKDEQTVIQKVLQKVDNLETSIQNKEKEIEELRSHVSTIKLGQQVRSAVKF